MSELCWCGRRTFSRLQLPPRRGGENFEFIFEGTLFTASVRYQGPMDLTPREVFLSAGKPDSAVDLAAKDAAVLVSIAMQYGIALEELSRSLSRNPDGSAGSPIGALLDILTKGDQGEGK